MAKCTQNKYNNVYASVGFHPTEIDVSEEDFTKVMSLLKDEKVVALGEIGLDYYYTKENKDKQKELFEEMLNLARNHDLPVIVHSRKSIQDTFDILKEYDVVGSMHCYQGSAEMAQEFIKLGFFIGVSGPVTHTNNKKIRKMIRKVDISNILVETDSPYLAPQEKRGEKNTPLNLKYIIGKIAEELDMSEEEVIKITSHNAMELFNL